MWELETKVEHTRLMPWREGETPHQHAQEYPHVDTLPFFTKHDGQLVDGRELFKGQFALEEAKRQAMRMPDCLAFCYKNEEMAKGKAPVIFYALAPGKSFDVRRSTEEVDDGEGLIDELILPEPLTTYKLEVPNPVKPTAKDKLLKMANKAKGLAPKQTKEEEQDRAWAVIHGFIVACVAILFFIVMMVMWFFVWHKSVWWSVIILLSLLILASVIVIWGAQQKKRRWVFIMGLVCFFVTILGLVVGFFWYFRYLAYYYRYLEMRKYTNVGASQPATQFNDGAMFLFTQDTRLDVLRSVGYRSKWSGEDMCVSPLVDSTMSAVNPISFWGVGTNCCLARSEYMCDDARDPTVMSALVMLEPWDVVRPFMQWAVRGSVYPRYEKAIKMQEAAFADRADKELKLVYWVKDPIAKRDSFYYEPRNMAIWFTVILFAILLVVCYFLCYHFRHARRFHEQAVNKEFKKQQLEAKKAPSPNDDNY